MNAPLRRFALLVFLFAAFVAPVPAAETPAPTPPPGDAIKKAPPAVPNSECMDCHEAEFKPRKKGQPKEWIGVKPEDYARSAHAKLDCVECHTTIKESSHDTPLPKVQCASCHEKSLDKHAFHPRISLSPMPAGKDTACTECHGAHDTAAIKDETFAFRSARQADACGRCHEATTKDYLASAHAALPAQGKRTTPDCMNCHEERIASQGLGRSKVDLKLAQAKLCESCHVDDDAVAAQSNLGAKFVSSFDRSVHGAALHQGKDDSAGCVDCHGAHAMNKAAVADSAISRLRITETCSKCHQDEAKEFSTSAHAIALQKGNLDSAGCTSCHGEHDIREHKDPTSRVHKTNLAQQVCAECHDSVRLTRRYGLATDTFKTFSDSYHGLAVRGGAVEVVNCASCHGDHGIKSQDDPTSTVHKANLAMTCGECHPGANTRFTVGAVHASESQREANPWLYWIANIYVALILLVVGGMVGHNLLDFLKKTRHKLAIQKGEIEEEHVAHRLYLRMTANERVQHAVLVISFTLLVITGFMLRYPEAWWVVGIRRLSVHAFEWRGIIHRVASVAMVASGIWHMGYLAFSANGRKLFFDLLPRWRDVTDPWHVFKYNIGLSPHKPAFDRFSYIEKTEYWAMAWGTVLMTVTGAVLWFDNTSMGYITKLGFDIARLVHFYEAVLATLAIIVWHFYFVVFNPDVYPMNLAWLTGRMSEREMMDEHPLHLAALKAAEQATGSGGASTPKAQPTPPTPIPPPENPPVI